MKIAERFMSIQGEGASVGVPAYFIRLRGCNLMCGGHNGSLVKENKATWWCDSEVVWRNHTEVSNEELMQSFESLGLLENILKGQTHLVWTGGEPTLPEHQKVITDFMLYADDSYENEIYNEIETNGTIVTEPDFYHFNINQINCSPKLANSGISEKIRIVPEAIKQIKSHANSYFKFVISTEDDVKEIKETYIQPFDIHYSKVIIMPGVDNRNDLPERTAFLFEMTKKYGYRGITRQHILAWNKCISV